MITDQFGEILRAGDEVLVKVGSGKVLRPGTVDKVTPTAVLVTFTWANGNVTRGRRFARSGSDGVVGTVTRTLNPTIDFQDGNGPVAAHRHENGGGWVADTATVKPTAWVGGNARVGGTRDTLPHADPFMGSRGLTPEQAKWLV
jgi:hypothetical protein